ncbi:MAG: OmpA family protein [Clostridia bacterium]|nr:OmpA family protein [Clostridia bacterium]
MRIRQRTRTTRRASRADGANWLSFSDLMSSILLIFILIMFYIMYQYFDMYEINMAEIARQQYDLDQANADLNEKTEKLSTAEAKLLAQQIRLTAAQKDLDDAESVLAQQQEELTAAQSLLDEKEQQITAQEAELDALGVQLNDQQAKLNAQQATLNDQQAKLNAQQTKLDDQQTKLDDQQVTLDQQKQTMDEQRDTMARQQETMDQQQVRLAQQQMTMDAQQMKLNEQQQTMDQQRLKLDEQQQTLEEQQIQIEQLVGLKTRIISSLSDALRAANISAQVDPTNGSIALESDVMFATGKSDLTDLGKQFIDEFLPVYLDVLLSEEYGQYVTEIIIEGHTDSTGGYIRNLQLSQERALAVASYVLADSYRGISSRQKAQLRQLVTANGRSWSDPVLDQNGHEDLDASRRVVFKFRMTDEQMIQQLKSILEKE